MKLNTLNKFLLVAHHPEKGRFLISDVHINYGIIGAALLELSFNGQIKIEDDKLFLINDAGSEKPILSDIILEISNSKKPRKIRYWITRLAQKSREFKWIILTELENDKLLRIEDRKFLGLIPFRKSYLIDTRIRENLIRELKKNILFRKNIDKENIAMLGLIEACQMHKIITSDKRELKTVKNELKVIIKENPIAGTVDETVKQVQAAIFGAIMTSTIAVSASGSN